MLTLLCSGPGRLCQALGVTHAHNGARLDRRPFRVVARGDDPARVVRAGVRIGISKSRELPWRFVLAGSVVFMAGTVAADPGTGLVALALVALSYPVYRAIARRSA